ncbi:HlyD family efflux transporter periplasmic adaptor subunit (plasmid) [Sinorhizobium sp. M103]|uniref:HlyD family efflux transporter periplasmic adaptor subunit n=1 Tax=Sinorhizobium sp. M103 TaxID=2976821 RepID=UPI0023D8075A|nr:HlyD family efflux transporter periplasmic adaptor subunit [Sinorhizobium sp. M103]WEJ13736.1 HlyD family efflux transporter periplasmic adaptor subunit [Sinorhizobium sp. M103]
MGVLDGAQQCFGHQRNDRRRFEAQDGQPFRGRRARPDPGSGGRSCGARPAADEARGYARPLRPGGAAKPPCRSDRKTGAAAGRAGGTAGGELPGRSCLQGRGCRGCGNGGKRVFREAERGQGGPSGNPAKDDRGIFGEGEVSRSPASGDRQADRADERAADRYRDPCRKSLRPALETHRNRRTAQRARRDPRRTRWRQGPGGKGDGGGRACAHRDRIRFPIGDRRRDHHGAPRTCGSRAAHHRRRGRASPPGNPRPQAGIVANIQLRTPGSAVTPGQPLLDIVPEDEPLLVEMHVSTRDIDSITIGSSTQIRLTAYNQRSHLPLEGKVTYIAADQSVDEKSNVAYFVARAEVAPESLAANPDIRLYPGMPAEVLIVHKSRSAIDYLVAPVSDSFNRAFRED